MTRPEWPSPQFRLLIRQKIRMNEVEEVKVWEAGEESACGPARQLHLGNHRFQVVLILGGKSSHDLPTPSEANNTV